MDCSAPGSSVHGTLQARTLEWVAIAFFRELPNPGIEPGFPALQADALPSEPPGKGLSFLRNFYTILHGEGNGKPLHYPFLENPMDREAWWAAVHGVAKSWAQLSN